MIIQGCTVYKTKHSKYLIFFFNTASFKDKLLSSYVTSSPNNILRIAQNTKLLNIVPSLNFWHFHPLRSTFSPEHRLLKSTAHVISPSLRHEVPKLPKTTQEIRTYIYFNICGFQLQTKR